MFIDNDLAEKQMENINNGLSWLADISNRTVQWVRATETFVFGHKEVQMTNAIIDKSAAVILASEPIRSNEDLKTIPNVRLVFDNEEGIDALMKMIENARADLRSINAKEKHDDQTTI